MKCEISYSIEQNNEKTSCSGREHNYVVSSASWHSMIPSWHMNSNIKFCENSVLSLLLTQVIFPLGFSISQQKHHLCIFFVMSTSVLLINSIYIHSHKLPLHTYFMGSVYAEEKCVVAVNEQKLMTTDHLGPDTDFVCVRCTESNSTDLCITWGGMVDKVLIFLLVNTVMKITL